MFFDWDFALPNTVLFAIGLGLIFVAQRIYERVPVTGLRWVLAGPFWLFGGVIVLIASIGFGWHMVGPYVEWFYSFF